MKPNKGNKIIVVVPYSQKKNTKNNNLKSDSSTSLEGYEVAEHYLSHLRC